MMLSASILTSFILLKSINVNKCCFNTSLCKTNHGEVSLSSCGSQWRLMFNNIVMIHRYESYLKLFKEIEDCHYHTKNDVNKNVRNIVFSTCKCSVVLCFSPEEIAELYYLLQSAMIEANIYV